MFGFRQHGKSTRAQCVHAKALPRWDRIEDSGNPDRVSSYYCSDCDQFLPAQPRPESAE